MLYLLVFWSSLFFSSLRGSTDTGSFEYTIDLDTGFVIARSVTLRDFWMGQFVAVVSVFSDLSLQSSVAAEKVTISRVELRP